MILIRILVTGSRDWRDRDAIINALRAVLAQAKALHPDRQPSLVHGDHYEGADAIADAYGSSLGFRFVEKTPAAWRKLGLSAGPVRNQAMVDLRPWVCVAFPIGQDWSGTRDCMARAHAAGIPVWVPADEPMPDLSPRPSAAPASETHS